MNPQIQLILTSLLFLLMPLPVDAGQQQQGQQGKNGKPDQQAGSPVIKLGLFNRFTDIGDPAIPGTAAYVEPSQTYRLSGSGENVWNDRDSFSFLWKKMKGDFILQSMVRFMDEGHHAHRKTGLMIRNSMDPGSPMVICTVHGDGLTSLQFRREQGKYAEQIRFGIEGPDVLQLEKKADTYTMSVARFGKTYRIRKLEGMELNEEMMAGLFVCSHTDEYPEEVEFWNTRIYHTAPDTLKPYNDYLDCMLEVMNVADGHRQILAVTDQGWQAPNWTPDGETLIYNSRGLLYNFDLDTRKSTVLNTDFADGNNNDHVLTFDGKQMGITHHRTLYTLPVTGGIPKEVETGGPSYLHGWSPDNRYLTYTALRQGDWDIYKVPVAGGDEIRLTTSEGLDDGSEYGPDGKYIYFCSTRTGTMQIWRMDTNGENQVQLTFDELNDWFPHVSPNNKWLVFISYPSHIPADSHPFYKRIYIRIMPVEGGKPKVIGYLYGGQGTMNVPSWSPDSKKISFVSNGNVINR